jgi:hypothetical protein
MEHQESTNEDENTLADLARELERIQTQAKRMLDLPFSVQL